MSEGVFWCSSLSASLSGLEGEREPPARDGLWAVRPSKKNILTDQKDPEEGGSEAETWVVLSVQSYLSYFLLIVL